MSNTRVLVVSVSRAATSARRDASLVSASGLADRTVPNHAPLAPAASNGCQASRRGDSTGRQHRHRYDVQHRVEQRERADRGVSVAATLGTAGHQEVDPGILGPLRLNAVVNLCGGGDPGIVDAIDPRQVSSEADRDNHGLRGQRGIEQLRLLANHPVHQANSERPTHVW